MAVQRKPKPAAVVDDKVAEAFIKGGGAPTANAEAMSEQGEAPEKGKRQDARTTPRFSIRLDRDTLDELEEILPAAKRFIKLPGHIRLTKSDFVEWCIREGIDRIKKAEDRKV
ncbi:MAG: hypothetical protein VR70_11095 [Rhodospirillaceae bacterium BRH_c57]|nr:MAG: hypothetical protein VR70_11095 [Rhodospirillaceae bacterium BRH_c57]